MAMGVSAQGSPFKPCCASSLWLAPSSFRRSSSSSAYAFSAPGKGFERQEIHSLQSGDGSCSRYCDSPSRFPKVEAGTIPRNPSTGFGRMGSYFPQSFSYKGKVFSMQSVEEEKRQNLRPRVHEPPVRGMDAITPSRASSYMPVSKTRLPDTSDTHSRILWHLESKIVRSARLNQQDRHNTMNGMVTAEIPQDRNIIRKEKVDLRGLKEGSDYDKLHFITDSFCDHSLDNSHNFAQKGATQNTFRQEYMGYDTDDLPVPALTQEINNGHASNVTLSSNELGIRGNSITADNLYSTRTKEYNLPKADFSLLQNSRRTVPYNGSTSRKPFIDHKENLSKLLAVRPESVIERGTYDNISSITEPSIETTIDQKNSEEECVIRLSEQRDRLTHIYDKVLVVDNISMAKKVVEMLTKKYKNLVHACDTEVAKIDVKQETPVGHGEIICFSVYSGPQADFGNGKSCVWVDVLDGGRDLLVEFAPFFEDPSIKKVWHNYSFDSHVMENYGFKVSGFHADTMHLARLWDSSRRTEGGYSLEALTSDRKVVSEAESCTECELISGKISMKTIFGKKKLKKDGSEGKLINVAPVEDLQRGERIPWICYSALDSISTLMLYKSLKTKLMDMKWVLDGVPKGSMYDFYEEYWRPFGDLLVKMESEGMLVDRTYLSEMEKVATMEQKVAADRFRNWASKYCPDAIYMNVGSDAQLRQLFFGGMVNRKDQNESLPTVRTFKVPNVDKVIEEGKKVPSKYRNITLHNLGGEMQAEIFTATGWPSVSGDALKTLAGKVSAEECGLFDDSYDFHSDSSNEISPEVTVEEDEERGRPAPTVRHIDTSSYGTAYAAFGRGKEGMEACHAIAALCEVCSIDSLISNFILPLQGCHVSGINGRIHCSLNINTETGRLSARRPNLQNQPALEKDRYKIRQAFIAEPGNSLIVADYGQLELRILAHLAKCKSMMDAFKAGGDFHSRTAMNMYPHVREAVEEKRVLLEWYPQPGEEKPPVPLLKDAFASERRKAKMLNFSIAYGKTPVGLSRDWKVSVKEARETVKLWYKERQEVLSWQEERKREAHTKQCVYTLLGRARRFPSMASASASLRGHIERAAINTPVQGSAADVAMCAMLQISRNTRLKELGWRLLLQVHDEVILEGPSESAEVAKAIVVECMSKPFYGYNFLNVDLSVDAKCAQNWYAAK